MTLVNKHYPGRIRDVNDNGAYTIEFDDGDTDSMFAETRRRGWIRDEDGDAHRMWKLRQNRPLDGKYDKLTCSKCGYFFDTERGLKAHQAGK